MWRARNRRPRRRSSQCSRRSPLSHGFRPRARTSRVSAYRALGKTPAVVSPRPYNEPGDFIPAPRHPGRGMSVRRRRCGRLGRATGAPRSSSPLLRQHSRRGLARQRLSGIDVAAAPGTDLAAEPTSKLGTACRVCSLLRRDRTRDGERLHVVSAINWLALSWVFEAFRARRGVVKTLIGILIVGILIVVGFFLFGRGSLATRIEARILHDSVKTGASFVTCHLPKTWVPGNEFDCGVFKKNGTRIRYWVVRELPSGWSASPLCWTNIGETWRKCT